MESKVKYIFFILIVVVFGIVIGTKIPISNLKNEIKQQNAMKNNIEKSNIVKNEVHNEIKNDSDSVSNNVIEENTTNESNNILNEVDSININVENNNLSEEDRALNIAKKSWGDDNNVYFKYEGIDTGKHIVSVREKETTVAINWYLIDLENETFEVN